MSSVPVRPLQIWQLSSATTLSRITGAFRIDVLPSMMVPQTLQFLHERSRSTGFRPTMTPFLSGSQYWREGDNSLFYIKAFSGTDELFAFDIRLLYELVQELEMHLDVNFTIVRISYLADVGSGPGLPLLVAEREPISRGIGFEIEERGHVMQSLRNFELRWTEEAQLAHRYYSTGLTLLALEDQVSGLMDAAYMQFYLATEAILGAYKSDKAIEKGTQKYGEKLTDDIRAAIGRVFAVRNDYFGHAGTARRRRSLTYRDTFSVVKQTLVARWCARALIELEVGGELVHREMRLYPHHGQSVFFDGDASKLDAEFAL